MAIKKFCDGCKHRNISPEIKTIFNEVVQETFLVCPIETTDKIAGCFTKNLEIDWDGFTKFCREQGNLKEEKNDDRTEG